MTQLTELASFYLYCAVRFLFEQHRESEIDSLIPDIPQFCGVVQDCLYASDMNEDAQRAIFANTIRCLQYVELTDNVCRQELLKTLRFLLSLTVGANYRLVVHSQNVYTLLQALLNVLDTESSFLRWV